MVVVLRFSPASKAARLVVRFACVAQKRAFRAEVAEGARSVETEMRAGLGGACKEPLRHANHLGRPRVHTTRLRSCSARNASQSAAVGKRAMGINNRAFVVAALPPLPANVAH